MQKLVISEQFMGVKPCTIELNRFLLLIGEQASGKSTISKLIYFFQTLPTVIYHNIVAIYPEIPLVNIEKTVILIVNVRFLQTFGASILTKEGQPKFDIRYIYDSQNKQKEFDIKVYQDTSISNSSVYTELSPNLVKNIAKIVKQYIHVKRIDERIDEIKARTQFLDSLNKLFNLETNEYSYLIAGRNNIVAFPDLFEKAIREELEKLSEDIVKKQDFAHRQRLGNERLLYEFVQWSSNIRNYFKNNGQTFEAVMRNLENVKSTQAITNITNNILKGQYVMANWGEVIRGNDDSYGVFLKDASSGQQEVLRILQGLLLSVGLKNRREFFVVEEPEAHLYPLAQKELINAFAVFLNTIKEGKLIITTHSPYILACINILLFAQYVAHEIGVQNGSINQVKREYWLDSSMFTAYSLGQNEAYCVNIKDAETGLIDQNYLDSISEQLGLQYQELYNLLTQETV
jgi:predicted ATP-dependent endonuclease of OLD family